MFRKKQTSSGFELGLLGTLFCFVPLERGASFCSGILTGAGARCKSTKKAISLVQLMAKPLKLDPEIAKR